MNDDVFQGGKDAIERFAALKGVPVSKVLKVALKDWIYAAYLSTPEAPRISPNPWAYLPGRGKARGKVVSVNLSNLPAVEAVRLSPYRLSKPNRGFALSAFVPLFQDPELEFSTKKKKGGTNRNKLDRQSRTFATKGGGDVSFKADIEGYRQGKSEGMTAPDFASTKHTESEFLSCWEATVNEIRLTQYPNWSNQAIDAGYARAAKNIIENLEKEIDKQWRGL